MADLDAIAIDVMEGKDVNLAINEAVGIPSFSNGAKVRIVHGMGMAVAGTPGVYKGEANNGFAIVETENGSVEVPMFALQARDNDAY